MGEGSLEIEGEKGKRGGREGELWEQHWDKCCQLSTKTLKL